MRIRLQTDPGLESEGVASSACGLWQAVESEKAATVDLQMIHQYATPCRNSLSALTLASCVAC